MGKKNRGTGRNLKPNEIQRDSNHPDAQNKAAHSTNPVAPYGSDFIYVGARRINIWNTNKDRGEENRDQRAQATQNSQNGMWLFVTRRLPWWLDLHHGAVAAVAAVFTLLATIVIAHVTREYSTYSKKQWQTMQSANLITQTTLNLSQRAYVTLGRKDGVIAEFAVPKDQTQNAEIAIYFQNSGRLPAKFTWGTVTSLLAVGSQQTGIVYTHPYNAMIRRRNKKTGAIGQIGESYTIAGDSTFVATLGEISQADLAQLPAKHAGVVIFGLFEYCDELGTYSRRQFGLGYRPAPNGGLSFTLHQDTEFPTVLGSTTETEDLMPCETFAEREQNKKNAAKR